MSTTQGSQYREFQTKGADCSIKTNDGQVTTELERKMPLDLQRIFAIESSNNERAHDKTDDSRGLGQITPGVLADYNRTHNTNIKPDDLFDRDINTEITNWYANEEIPRLLTHWGIEDTDENRIIAYNAGPGNLRKILSGEKELPEVTENYLIKYQMGGDVRIGQQRLLELGFNPGPIDGKFGPKTKKAFLEFQQSDIEAPIIPREFGMQSLKR